MPTVHVTPGSDLLLQDIANALHKAKKVVVVTGAGISTNSGIPDFRSENGLYSLIQAQFDAASRELEKREEERAEAQDVRSSPPLIELVQARPSKRRKLSIEDEESARSEPKGPAEKEETRNTTNLDASQQSPRGLAPPADDPDQPTTHDEDNCITVDDGLCITVGAGMDITVATEGSNSVIEESIVVLGDTAMEGSLSGIDGDHHPDTQWKPSLGSATA
ncbi:hypothetical protein NKR19_g7091 [Coniochaeta hoffmannii]|uniref:Deacetylase sirtuin-type domain-containing protein n=1 Tax=Coniochaeta hoffmannii TaxID=91930 RepID=A0AA38RCM8_9PEZI|nr:hypothetical protein NKR19_g7091 [Coniochaeta hoffmannii]